MDTLEAWRFREASCVCPKPQITAFHLVTLTEEKFRVRHLSGSLTRRSPLAAHICHRDDLFALEWALRSLKLPDGEFMQIERLRTSWTKGTAQRATNLLAKLSGYYHVRDLVICTKRGGYLLDTPSENVFHFADNPDWPGVSDVKSRLMSERVSAERNVSTPASPQALTLEQTTLHGDFPHGIDGTSYSSSDFWSIWSHLWRMCVDEILEDCEIRSYGDHVATRETRELGLIITKKKLTDAIAKATAITRPTVSMLLHWIMFNSQTPGKFTLFHCPLVEINEKFVMIPPHAFVMAHVPTVFLRHLAHNDKKLYDACSGALEKQGLGRLKSHIETDDRTVRIGVKLQTTEGETEIDLVEYEKSQSVLSIAQAKLTIRSDSVAEVDHKNEVLAEGIGQLKRDRDLLSRNQAHLTSLLAKIGEQSEAPVTTRYFLLPTKSAPSDFVHIPSWIAVLPIEFCLRPQCKGRSLLDIHAEYNKLWNSLDQAVSASKCEEEFEIGGFKIVYPAFSV